MALNNKLKLTTLNLFRRLVQIYIYKIIDKSDVPR